MLGSLNPEVEDIELNPDDDASVFAELVRVLPDARVQSDKPMTDEVTG